MTSQILTPVWCQYWPAQAEWHEGQNVMYSVVSGKHSFIWNQNYWSNQKYEFYFNACLIWIFVKLTEFWIIDHLKLISWEKKLMKVFWKSLYIVLIISSINMYLVWNKCQLSQNFLLLLILLNNMSPSSVILLILHLYCTVFVLQTDNCEKEKQRKYYTWIINYNDSSPLVFKLAIFWGK